MRRAAILAGFIVLVMLQGATAGQQPSGLLTAATLGLQLHDAWADNDESDSVDFQGEIRFRSISLYDGDNSVLRVLLRPEPTVGLAINSGFDTNQAYAGVSWPIGLGGGFYLLPFFGGVVHDGNTDDGSGDEPNLGSHVLFREAIDLGYRLAERHALALSASHMSNAGLSDENDGMSFVGIRYSYFFP